MASPLKKNDWPFPKFFTLKWRLSQVPLFLIGHSLVKLYLRFFQQVQTQNISLLQKAIQERPKGTGLVTVSNHTSCIDDPVLWGTLPLKNGMTTITRRWTPAAKEICFTNKLFNALLTRTQIVPIVRGDGVYQKAVNFCVELLNEGHWIHFFPEGKVNLTNDNQRLKWGKKEESVGRLIAEAKIAPIVLPIWHVGMDDLLPNRTPYIPQLFKRLTVLVGDPLDVSNLILSQNSMNPIVIRKHITDLLQEKMKEMKLQAEQLHNEWSVSSPFASRTI